MMTLTGGLLVPLYFLLVTLSVGFLAWRFFSFKKEALRFFGFGLLGYTLGCFFWTLVVILRPQDLKPLILAGAIPFLLAHLFFATVATKNKLLLFLTGILILIILYTRSYLFPSEPYFSSQGLLYFGLSLPVSILYVLTLSVSFLPAIFSISSLLKKTNAQLVMYCFLAIYVTSVVLVLIKNDMLLLLNGIVMTGALLILVFRTWKGNK